MTDAALKMSEAELQRAVIELAETLGWRVFHARPAMNRDGSWSTAMAGTQSAGFPDLCCVRERLVMIELKSERGRTTAAQQDWLFALTKAGIECHIFWPLQWHNGEIEEVLRAGKGGS